MGPGVTLGPPLQAARSPPHPAPPRPVPPRPSPFASLPCTESPLRTRAAESTTWPVHVTVVDVAFRPFSCSLSLLGPKEWGKATFATLYFVMRALLPVNETRLSLCADVEDVTPTPGVGVLE